MLEEHFQLVVQFHLVEGREVVEENGELAATLQHDIMEVEEYEEAHHDLAVHAIGDTTVPWNRISPILR